MHPVPGTNMFMLPGDLQQEEEEGDNGPTDPNDDANFEHGWGVPAWADPLDPSPLANFILSNMISYKGVYDIIYDTVYMIS